MKKNIFALAALLIASATMFTACSSDDNIISEQPANPTGKYTMTVQASKGDGATTRALSLDGSTLNAAWAAGEAVTVYNVTKDAALSGTLTAQGSGASTTLKGELTGTVEPNDVLTLKFLSPTYGTQDGTLTGSANSIDKVCDYAEAPVTVASVAGGNITTTADADFENKQSIVKFTLKDKSTNAGISATELVVNDGTSDYTVTPASATDVLYVALPDITSKTLTLTATVGSDTYTYEKASVSFTNGQYYEITVKMTKQATGPTYPIALSAVTADYLGSVVTTDGNVYATVEDATAASKTAVAMIAYVGSDAETSTTYNHGLALALSDAGHQTWCSQDSETCLSKQYSSESAAKADMAGIANTDALVGHGSHTHAAATAARNYNGGTHPTGTSEWFLPSAGQWDKMATAAGGYANLQTNAGLELYYYWSSSEVSAGSAWDFFSSYGDWYEDAKYFDDGVRACLAF